MYNFKEAGGQVQSVSIIYQYRQAMHLEAESQEYRGGLDYLLDCSGFSDGHRQNGAIDFSISKDKLNLSQKERTRQESFEDILKQIKQAKLQQFALNNQLENLKRRTYEAYLEPFKKQFQQLNQENVTLRAELKQCRHKVKQDKSQRVSNRSSIKVRSSINSTYGDENKKTNAKPRPKPGSPNMLLKKRQAKVTESTTNLGCSQVVSPRIHRRRQSQLTQRKPEENFNSVGISVNASYYQQKASQFHMKESVSKGHLRNESFDQRNVFVQILDKMLIQEQVRQEDKYRQLYLEASQKKVYNYGKSEVVYINELEQEIKIANEKLQMIGLIMKRYQSEIQGMNVNLKSVDEVFKRLWAVKGRFIQMEQRCLGLHGLRREVNEKKEILGRKKANLANETQQQKAIVSVQTLIKLITNNPNKIFSGKSSNLYCSYYKEVRQLFKTSKQQKNRKQLKMTKVREMIDNIRQGRKKFNELIEIYQARISKLEEKIARVRGEQVLREERIQKSAGSARK